MLENLKAEIASLGKPGWRPMLLYTAELHERSTHPPRPPFPYPWEEIGPGYCYGPAFGHWDLIHQVLDALASEPEHARNQLLNNLAAQRPDGFLPGAIWMRDEQPRFSGDPALRVGLFDGETENGHPPVWPVAVQEYADLTGSTDLIAQCYEPLIRQIDWFEKNRKAEPTGFYYTDILTHSWESGVDEGVRFDDVATGPLACVDATAHVYGIYEHAGKWSEILGKDPTPFTEKAGELRTFMQQELFDEETGFFHDIWSVGRLEQRPLAFEGMFPMVVGAATEEQARRVIEENLLEPTRFFAKHPIASVAVSDPKFELRMWRGPTWNSMTYWAARGCLRYGRADAARKLSEAALDASARQFERTGTIWEFYHPQGGRPEDLQRKPQTRYNTPCRDYLGHNPLIALARLWEATGGS